MNKCSLSRSPESHQDMQFRHGMPPHKSAKLPEAHNHLHTQALEIVSRYKSCEFELIEILQKVDSHKVFYSLGYSSLFKYATQALGLSEEVAYIFITVARKSREVPLLKSAIKDGTITVSKAKRIAPVLNSQNQKHWLELAQKTSKRELERQVALSAPKLAVVEKMNYVHPSDEVSEKAKIISLPEARVQLQVGVSEELMLKLRRAQDVESQKQQRSVTLEEVLAVMTNLYLEKLDPLAVAKRQKIRGKLRLKVESSVQDEEPRARHMGQSLSPSQTRQLPAQADVNEPCPGTVCSADASTEIVAEKSFARKSPVGAVLADTALTDTAFADTARARTAKTRIRRAPLTADLRHKLSLKYQGQCAHVDTSGRRCSERRFLHIHHIKPAYQGGQNELFNLQVLCSGHHRAHHME